MTTMPESRTNEMSVRVKAVPRGSGASGVFITKVRTNPIKLGKGTKNKRRMKALKESSERKAPLEGSLLDSSGVSPRAVGPTSK